MLLVKLKIALEVQPTPQEHTQIHVDFYDCFDLDVRKINNILINLIGQFS